MNMKKTLIASAVTLALLGTNAANAELVTGVLGNGTWSTDHANFTMLDAIGASVGGTNNVNMFWDGNAFNASSDYTGPSGVSNVTASSTSPFFGHNWTAHDMQIFLPGSYSFDTTLGGGDLESGMLNATVGAGQLGMHMLFDWNANLNNDVFIVFGQEQMFGFGVLRTTANQDDCDQFSSLNPINNCLWAAGVVAGYAPIANQVWMLASVDGNADGVMGIPLVPGGPLADFNINFNANFVFTPAAVPIPAAVWLFSSGLIGLLGAAHRSKTNCGVRL